MRFSRAASSLATLHKGGGGGGGVFSLGFKTSQLIRADFHTAELFLVLFFSYTN